MNRYLARRQMKDGDVVYQPGDEVPDVESWHTFDALLDLGWIEKVEGKMAARQEALREGAGGPPVVRNAELPDAVPVPEATVGAGFEDAARLAAIHEDRAQKTSAAPLVRDHSPQAVAEPIDFRALAEQNRLDGPREFPGPEDEGEDDPGDPAEDQTKEAVNA